MQISQRELVFVGLVGAAIYGFHYLSMIGRRNWMGYTAPRQTTFAPKPKITPVITDPRHPYWQNRLCQYWNYNTN